MFFYTLDPCPSIGFALLQVIILRSSIEELIPDLQMEHLPYWNNIYLQTVAIYILSRNYISFLNMFYLKIM